MAERFSLIAENIYETLDYLPGNVVKGVIRSGQVAPGDYVFIVRHDIVTKGNVIKVLREDWKLETVPSAFSGQRVTIIIKIPPDSLSLGLLGLVSAEETVANVALEIADLRKSMPCLIAVYAKTASTYVVTKIITQHYLTVLLEKYEQLTYVDAYDCLELEDFEKEVSRFIRKKLPDIDESYAKDIIIDMVQDAHEERRDNDSDFEKGMDPFEYEKFCARQLTASGWKALVTKCSGDQGGDIIADKDGLRIVIQCKLYNQPVGNKAVQEVFAAKTFHGAAAAYVVSNSSFTKSAYQLASSLGVELIHHENLNDI